MATYTERTSRSWFSRVWSSLGGALLGVLFLVAGTWLLWWNEGDFVKTRDALMEAQGITVEIEDPARVDAAFDGQLVHVTGRADTHDVLVDPVFGIGGRGIALERTVEFYQWTESSRSETRQTVGGGEETVTTYSYDTQWTDSPVASAHFHVPEARSRYVNTVLLPVDDATQYAANVRLGAYRLPPFLVREIGGQQPFPVQLDEAARQRLTRTLLRGQQDRYGWGSVTGRRYGMPGGHAEMLHTQGNTLYVGFSPATPQVGDVRVTFHMTPSATVSCIARVTGGTFEPFQTANGKKISLLSMGTVDMEAMFAEEQTENTIITWLLRFLGTCLVIVGLHGICAPLAVMVSVIPLLERLVGAGVGLVCGVLGLAWSLAIMAVAWLRYRPVIGGIMLAVGIALVVLLFLKDSSRRPSATKAAVRG